MEENVNINIPKQWKFLNNYIYRTLIYYGKNNNAIPKTMKLNYFNFFFTMEKKNFSTNYQKL